MFRVLGLRVLGFRGLRGKAFGPLVIIGTWGLGV